MEKLKYLKGILELLKNPNQDSLLLSMSDVHHEGLFSLVIAGNEFGKLTRVFIADKELKPFECQLHTHRYPLKLTPIKGNITHHTAIRSDDVWLNTVEMSEFEYKSPLNGGFGLKYLHETNVMLKDYSMPIGCTSLMTENEFHTVSCEVGAIWIVEELGFKNEGSLVLGVPFITEGLYNKPESFQINDKHQIVKKYVSQIINHYENI